MKKLLVFLLVVTFVAALLVGCTGGNDDNAGTDDENGGTDVVTTASLVNEEDALVNAVSENGTWIIAILNDISTDQELVLAGDFYNKGDETQDLYRKLALYAQDDNHKVTARYTLTAPKLTVKSPNAKIQGGTFAGDVYVEANGFSLTDGTIDGDLYFATQEMKDTFTMENGAKITGAVKVDGTDVVTTASIVQDDEALKAALSSDGAWIVPTLNNITVKGDLVIEGEFHDKGDETMDIYRKVAPYTQDESHKILSRFTLKADQIIVKSPNTRFQGGTFTGNIIVQANGFNLSDCTVDGSVYFASQEYMDSYSADEASKITGESVVGEPPVEDAAE